MNRVAIISSGFVQFPLINAARRMGLYVVVISFNSDICYDADKVYVVNPKDYKEILKICRYEKIDGICSVGLEQAVIPISIVNDKLRLNGITIKQAHIFTNKFLMKKVFKTSNAKFPNYILGNVNESLFDIIQKCNVMGFPLVFKPINFCSSNGIFKVNSKSEIVDSLFKMKKYTKDIFLIEEYICGESFGIEVCVKNGKIVMFLPLGNISVNNFGIDIPVGHFFSYKKITTEMCSKLKAIIQDIVNNCNIKNAFLTIDFRIDNNQDIYFLEIGIRCGGIFIPELISLYYNCDIYETLIKHTLDLQLPNLICDDYKDLCIASGFIIGNHYEYIDVSKLKGLSNVLNYEVYKVPKYIASKKENVKLGYVTVKCTNEQDINSLFQQIISQCVAKGE